MSHILHVASLEGLHDEPPSKYTPQQVVVHEHRFMHLAGIADQSDVRPFRKTKLSRTSQEALQLLRMISQCILMEAKAMEAHLQSSKGMLSFDLHQ